MRKLLITRRKRCPKWRRSVTPSSRLPLQWSKGKTVHRSQICTGNSRSWTRRSEIT